MTDHTQLIGRLTVTHEDIDRADHFFGCWPHVTVPTYFPAALAEAFARHRIASALSLITERDELREALAEMAAHCVSCDGSGTAYTMCDETDIGQPPGSSGITCPECSRARQALHNTTNHGEASGTITSREGEEA